MIDTVYKTLQTIVNKEQDGYVSPEEFNQLAKQVQDKIFRNYFEDYNRDQNKENRGLTNTGYGNLVSNQTEKLEPFLKEVSISISSGSYTLPSDLYYMEENGVISDTGKVVDKVSVQRFNYLGNSISGPSEVFPIYKKIGNAITVFPSTITGDLSITYIKIPSDPKWTYTIVSGTELYNPSSSSFQDFELHPSEFSNIVLEMLSYFGINLREGEVVQVAEQLKNTLNVKDNA